MPKKADELYLAFPDGVFHYECAQCNAFCCRGYGFAGSFEREMRPLFARYPMIQGMATKRTGDFVVFSTPASGCILLGSDNRCRIEKDLGKAAKPSICRLFPFNSFTRIGKTVVVSPHFLCPLRVEVPARPGEVEGTHSRVEAAVRDSGILDKFYIDQNVPRLSLHPSSDAASVLRREIRFRDLCSKAIGRRRFRDVLESESSEGLDEFVERATRLMGSKPPRRSKSRDRLDEILLALAPALRLELLSLSTEDILRALALGEAVVRQLTATSEGSITPKGVYSILQNSGPALRLLARDCESFVRIRPARLKTPSFGDPELTFAAFATLRGLGSCSDPLRTLEDTLDPLPTASDRVVLLTQLGQQIDGAVLGRRGRQAQVA
jgi:hypothetical protein